MDGGQAGLCLRDTTAIQRVAAFRNVDFFVYKTTKGKVNEYERPQMKEEES